MNILILHLSDLHFNNYDNYSFNNINYILNTLPKDVKVSAIIVVVSGDIAYSGEKEQYDVAFKFFSEIKERLIKKYTTQYIYIMIVPGNHDINYKTKDYSHHDVEQMYMNHLIDDNMTIEFEKMNEFYSMAQKFYCFEEPEKLISIKKLNIDGNSIQLNLINTAIFSLREEEDKGMHYLPQKELDRLLRHSDADFILSIMHHTHHWFNPQTKNILENILYENTDMLFTGHEHYISNLHIEKSESEILLYAGGILCDRGNWGKSEFYAGILNTHNRKYTYSKFSWDNADNIYIHSKNEVTTIPKNRINKFGLKVNKNFLTSLCDDKYYISNSYYDYYVFPLLEKMTDNNNVIPPTINNMKDFLIKINESKKIIILGGSEYGKTLISKELFRNFKDSIFVILITHEDVNNNNFERIIKRIYGETYSDSSASYEYFIQADIKDKIIIIDNADKINEKFQNKFIDYAEQNFGTIIQTRSSDFNLDIKDRIKQKIITQEYTIWEIQPFYSDKRRQLVTNIVRLLNKENAMNLESQNNLINTLCNLLTTQHSLFSFTPDFIIQFAKYYCINIGETIHNDGEVFSKVFESNLISQIHPYSRKLSVDKIFIILDKIAYNMHLHRTNKFDISQISIIINQYNEEFDSDVDITNFLNVLTNAKIFKKSGNEYKFRERTYLAYFIAREMKRRCGQGDTKEFYTALNLACYYINSDILMFLTYITDDLRMIELIMKEIEDSTNDWEQFCASPVNIQYLSRTNQLKVKKVNNTDKDKLEMDNVNHEREIEHIKREENQDEIYIFDETSELSWINKIIKVLSLLRIIARTLPSFEHMMKKDQKKKCVEFIYMLPLKIFNKWAQWMDENKLDIIHEIKDLHEWEYRKESSKLSENDVLSFLQWESISILLEIMNMSMRYATKENTHKFIDSFEYHTDSLYTIEHLMGLDNRDSTEEFCAEAIQLSEREHENLIRIMLLRVARHHMITSQKIPRTIIQILNQKLWNGKLDQRRLLIEKSKSTYK